MDKERLEQLFEKYIQKTATPAEKKEFLRLLTQDGADDLLRIYAEKYSIPASLNRKLSESSARRILEDILHPAASENNKVAAIKRFHFLRGRRVWGRAAAAVVLFTIGFYVFLLKSRKPPSIVSVADKIIKDAPPGHTGAILTLSDGKTYVLDTAHNGVVTKGFIKSSNLIDVSDTAMSYALLKTLPGREQQLRLSDGTMVWLNASSSIRFPTAFKGAQREVEITGEVYFEVAHRDKQPFIVRAGNQLIQDLGTHFDVNAYQDEVAVKTTLLEGKVQVNGHYILNPGEQFAAGTITKVNTDATIAWISGYFEFEHADIQTVMRQIARWYNVKVNYQGTVPKQVFGGEIQRSLMLSEVLELLAETGIHYTLDGNKLTIHS